MLIHYPCTLRNNIYHSNKREPLTIFHSDTNPTLDHVLVHSVDRIHALVVTMELIWLLFLNMLSFNFLPTLNKSLRFTRFRGSYVNRPTVVLTNHCQSYVAFLLEKRCSKWPHSFFCSCWSPMIVCLRNLFLLSTPVARMLLIPM